MYSHNGYNVSKNGYGWHDKLQKLAYDAISLDCYSINLLIPWLDSLLVIDRTCSYFFFLLLYLWSSLNLSGNLTSIDNCRWNNNQWSGWIRKFIVSRSWLALELTSVPRPTWLLFQVKIQECSKFFWLPLIKQEIKQESSIVQSTLVLQKHWPAPTSSIKHLATLCSWQLNLFH